MNTQHDRPAACTSAARTALAAALLTLLSAGCDGGDRSSADAHRAVVDSPAARAASQPVPEVFDHVVLVSVDGLRPECLEPPLLERFPNFARLLRGPHTLEARTDPDITVTLPNHLSMLTGRPVLGDAGHGWTSNSDPPAIRHGGTLLAQKGTYVASVFDVAHDHGVSTAASYSKTKFCILLQSYGAETGAPDAVGADNGTCKIDRAQFASTMEDVALAVTSWLGASRGPSFIFAHFAAPDVAGHSTGWDLSPTSPYIAAVAEVDAALGQVLGAIDRSESLAGRTAIVLTADHGGGVPERNHIDTGSSLNFRIPFLVWLGSDRQGADLVVLNPSRRQLSPGLQVVATETPRPIRNGDAGNLALRLLGLPTIDGSTYGKEVPLRVRTTAGELIDIIGP